ncbi:hypothetical protein KSP40_PGU007072 [Platanthera guangdongensis]|uniref:Uncharacterized protein n=1 Tax=Platanthera guangdongensis TaxID=2320717 RepID=A0ABR2MD65_9ASPA
MVLNTSLISHPNISGERAKIGSPFSMKMKISKALKLPYSFHPINCVPDYLDSSYDLAIIRCSNDGIYNDGKGGFYGTESKAMSPSFEKRS